MSNKNPSKQSAELLSEIDQKKENKAKEIQLTETEIDALPKEINGPKGLEPTRYGDWESKGRCYDF